MWAEEPTNEATATVTPTPTPNIDSDGDGVLDGADNCPVVYNPDQLNSDGGRRANGAGIAGEWASNPSQDKLGDACDPDDDNDGLPDVAENELSCPYRLQGDSDGDRALDGFEVATGYDPCNALSKPAWGGGSDLDGDGLQDGLERSGYNTCAFTGDAIPGYSACTVPTDSDGDGCSDTLEALDINGDRAVDIADQLWLARRMINLLPVSDSDRVFDLDKDGYIDIADQLRMARNTCFLRPNQIGCPVCPAE